MCTNVTLMQENAYAEHPNWNHFSIGIKKAYPMWNKCQCNAIFSRQLCAQWSLLTNISIYKCCNMMQCVVTTVKCELGKRQFHHDNAPPHSSYMEPCDSLPVSKVKIWKAQHVETSGHNTFQKLNLRSSQQLQVCYALKEHTLSLHPQKYIITDKVSLFLKGPPSLMHSFYIMSSSLTLWWKKPLYSYKTKAMQEPVTMVFVLPSQLQENYSKR
jgi:hypothetical protein